MSLPLPHTASVEQNTGVSPAGEPTFGAAVTYACRFDRITEYARDGETTEVLTDAEFIFAPAAVVNEGDRITITANGITYIGTAIESSRLDAINGKTHHTEVKTRSK